MRTSIALLVLTLMFVCVADSPISAQETLSPDNLQPITADNITQLTELATIGYGGFDDMTWSPDGQTLIVQNQVGLWLHDASDLSAEPRLIPEQHFIFSTDSAYIITWRDDEAGVRVWESHSGNLTGENWQDIALPQNWMYQVSTEYTSPLDIPEFRLTITDVLTNTLLGSMFLDDYINYEVSPTHQWVVTHDWLQTFLVDISNGGVIFTTGGASSPTFSPDGYTLAANTFDKDNNIKLFDLTNDIPSLRLQIPSKGSWWMSFTADSQSFVTLEDAHSLQVWDAVSGERKRQMTFDQEISYPVIASGRNMLAVAQDNTILLCDLDTAAVTTELPHDHPIVSIKFSPDGRRVATATTDGVVRLWDTTTGVLLDDTSRYFNIGFVMAISPDSSLLVTHMPGDEFIVLWDIRRRELLKQIPSPSPDYTPIVFSPDGGTLAIGGIGVTLFDLATGATRNYGGGGGVWGLAFSPDGHLLASANHFPLWYDFDDEFRQEDQPDDTLRVQDAQTGDILVEIDQVSGYANVAFSPDGRLLVAAGVGAPTVRIYLWDVETLLQGDQTPLTALWTEDVVGDITFSPDGSLLAVGYNINRLPHYNACDCGSVSASVWAVETLIDSQDETQIEPRLSIPGSEYSQIFYSPDGSLLFAKSDVSFVTAWDAKTGDQLNVLLEQGRASMSPDGKLLMTRGYDRRIHYWGVPNQ